MWWYYCNCWEFHPCDCKACWWELLNRIDKDIGTIKCKSCWELFSLDSSLEYERNLMKINNFNNIIEKTSDVIKRMAKK
jgi:hypothetical protein